MSPFHLDRTIAGVDGCKAGWVAAVAEPDGRFRLAVFPAFDVLLGALSDDAVVAVDMPIGLPGRVGKGGREAEAAARAYLRRFKSSVFSIPSRRAVEAEVGPWRNATERSASHRRASAVARDTSSPSRGMSIQTFGILPKIREIDGLLRAKQSFRERVVESHPEVVFQRLGGEAAPHHPKASAEGGDERRALLLSLGLPEHLFRARPSGVGRDDILDAAALLFTAARVARGEAQTLPAPFNRDAFGLPVAIWL